MKPMIQIFKNQSEKISFNLIMIARENFKEQALAESYNNKAKTIIQEIVVSTIITKGFPPL